jgi:hypothetical protein
VTRQSGALRIFLYNWPVYVATWVASLAVALVAYWLSSSWQWAAVLVAAMVGAAVALGWSLLSLVVSHYIYDRSPLVAARWVPALLPTPTRTWATIHAGLDAEVDVEAVLEGRCLGNLDIFDVASMTSPSIRRARERTQRSKPATVCKPDALALPDAGCDAVVVVFSAHEIRDQGTRERFFEEVRRALRPGGKALLVEHLRDVPNFIAFGLGFVHFLPRTEWLRLAEQAGLTVVEETRITPWVMALALERVT